MQTNNHQGQTVRGGKKKTEKKNPGISPTMGWDVKMMKSMPLSELQERRRF